MKKRFNIYVILFIIALAVGFTIDGGLMLSDMRTGMEQGMVEYNLSAGNKKDVSIVEVKMKAAPNSGAMNNRLTNALTGEQVPAQYNKVSVAVANRPTGLDLGMLLMSLVAVVMIVWFWVNIIKIIVRVNKGLIFTGDVERRLFRIGIIVLVCYGCEWLFSLYSYYLASSSFAMKGYEVALDVPDSYALYIGFGLLVIAQIFAIGRKMKEEQDLTI